MAKLKWEDPPVTNKRRGDAAAIDKVVAQLKKRPGQWAVVREHASSGSYITYKKRGCETRTESDGKGRYRIYAMYPGDVNGD